MNIILRVQYTTIALATFTLGIFMREKFSDNCILIALPTFLLLLNLHSVFNRKQNQPPRNVPLTNYISNS